MFFLLGWSLTFVLQTWKWSSLVFWRGLLQPLLPTPSHSPWCAACLSSLPFQKFCHPRHFQVTWTFNIESKGSLAAVMLPYSCILSFSDTFLRIFWPVFRPSLVLNFFSDTVWFLANTDDKNCNVFGWHCEVLGDLQTSVALLPVLTVLSGSIQRPRFLMPQIFLLWE